MTELAKKATSPGGPSARPPAHATNRHRRAGRDRITRPRSVRWALSLGRLAILGQLGWLVAFSVVEYRRGGLTHDFALYDQARWLIVHGHLAAYDTVLGRPFWQNNGEALMWPLAEITRLPGAGLWLLLLQAAAIAGCGWVALSWVAEWVSAGGALPDPGRPAVGQPTGNGMPAGGESAPPRGESAPPGGESTPAGPGLGAATAVGLAALLLVVNPWAYTTAAFDVHFESFAALFALLAARDLWRGRRRRLWLWVALTASAGEIGGLLLLGVGVGGLLGARRRRRRASLGVVAAGVVWLGLVVVLHGNLGPSDSGVYAYLARGSGYAGPEPSPLAIVSGALDHPGRVVADLRANLGDIWANLAPAGVIGLVNPWSVGVAVVVLASSILATGPSSHLFSQPGFQNFPVYPFVTVGTVMLLVWLGRWSANTGLRRAAARAAKPAAALACGLSLAWAVVWLPRYPSEWLTVTPAGGRGLALARSLIPPGAQVIASQGVVGRFADRVAIDPLMTTPATFALRHSPVYIVLTATQGLEMPVQQTDAALDQIASTPGVTLVEHRSGIWLWRWDPPPARRSLGFHGPGDQVDAWTLRSQAGSVLTSGPPSRWHIAGDGRPGDVAYGDYWFETPGAYRASVELSTTGPAEVQVWNDNTGALLAERLLGPGAHRERVVVAFEQTIPGRERIYRGWGPLRVAPFPPPAGQPVEVRVYVPGTAVVDVYRVGVRPAGPG